MIGELVERSRDPAAAKRVIAAMRRMLDRLRADRDRLRRALPSIEQLVATARDHLAAAAAAVDERPEPAPEPEPEPAPAPSPEIADRAKLEESMQRAEQYARTRRSDALSGSDAAGEAADRALDDRRRADAAQPRSNEVDQHRARAADAAKQATSIHQRTIERFRQLDDTDERIAAERRRFERALNQGDRKDTVAAIDAVERLGERNDSAADEIAAAQARAEELATEATRHADAAEAAARRAADAAEQADRDAARRKEVEELLAELRASAARADMLSTELDELRVRTKEQLGRLDELVARVHRAQRVVRASRSERHRIRLRAIVERVTPHVTAGRDAATKLLSIADDGDRRVATVRGIVAEAERHVEAGEWKEGGTRRLVELRNAADEQLRFVILELTEEQFQALLDALGVSEDAADEAGDIAADVGPSSNGGPVRPSRPPGSGGTGRPPTAPAPAPAPEPGDGATDVAPPLLLFPIRIETRFGERSGDAIRLRIRIYPDQIGIDGGLGTPTDAEVEIATRYWLDHHAAQNSDERRAAWSALVDQLDIHRAGHVARLTHPIERDGELDFPDVATTEIEPPGSAALLPDRFVAIGWKGDTELFRVEGADIDRRPYHTSPDLTDGASAPMTTADGLIVTEHMRWMLDYDHALERGMAIDVDLDASVARIDTLLVVGIQDDRHDDAIDDLAALFETHSISEGFAFVPQGTPTNNTDSVDAGWTRVQRERQVVAERRQRELGDPGSTKTPNADRFARALGLGESGALARQPFADDPEWERSRAMRLLLFDVVIGRYLDELTATEGKPPIPKAARRELQTWFTEHVTGGAVVPSFRVGAQPYGVLPILRRENVDRPPTIGDRVRRFVEEVRDEWQQTFDDGVPRLDHEAGEDPTSLPGDIAAVLASEPHPADLAVRRLDLHADTGLASDGYTMVPIIDVLGAFGDAPMEIGEVVWVEIDNGFVTEFEQDLDQIQSDAPDLWDQLVQMRSQLGTPQTIHEQIILWSKFRELVWAITQNPWGEGAEANVWVRARLREAADMLPVVDGVVAQLAAHEQRQRPYGTIPFPDFNGVLGQPNPAIVVSKFAADAPLVERALVADDTWEPADYLAAAASGTLTDVSTAPLLAQLVAAAADDLAGLPPAQVNAAVASLAQTSHEQLEWLLRETLGLGIHRLDAWHTARANEELLALRRRRPEGTQIGAYAWVTELDLPDGSDPTERTSRGFLHAPTLAHATTAAVIRSAWHARGDADGRSPAAVDLRSNRYRFASWLIEGVRAGQSLGDLLGYEFERLCHDLAIDEQIGRVRVIVAEAADRADGLEDPVDGLELMELFDTGGLDQHLQQVEREFSSERAETLRLLLQGLTWAFDAVDDALLAEATHHLLTGNLDRAAAVLQSGATGDVPPPMPEAMNVSVGATTIEHKVVLVADASPAGSTGWASGIRDSIAAGFEGFAASVLPHPDQVEIRATSSDGQIDVTSLGQLGISALDAVFLASDDPTTVSASFRSLIRSVLGDGIGKLDPTASSAQHSVSFEEFQIAATAVRRLLSEARPATVADLDPSHVGNADASDADLAVDGASAAGVVFGTVITDAATGAIDRRRLALCGIVGDDAESIDVARRRHDAAAAMGTAPARDVYSTLLGRPVPVGPVVDGSSNLTDASLVDSPTVLDWLDDVSVVRPDVARVIEIDMFRSMLGGAEPLVAGSAQSPKHPGDGWAAVTAPSPGTGGRTVTTVVWAGSDGPPSSEVVGLVIDQWSEPLPASSVVTGVAVHYDAPSQRPPQALVLGVPQTTRRWSLDGAVTLVLDTLDWVHLRAVAPEDLGDFGHTLPTVFSTAELHPGPVTEEVAP